VAVGDYEQIENDRRRAWKLARGLYDPEDRAVNERRYEELRVRREQYLRDLLAQLPFRWYIAHAYTAQETGSYGGADHIVVDEPIRIGRLSREPGDALSRPSRKFWGLHKVVENDRLPTSLADIKIAERIVATPPLAKAPKTHAQLDREIVDSLKKRSQRKP
jgi:hypothetical protein